MGGDQVGFAGERRALEGIITLSVAIQSSESPGIYAQRHVDFIVLRAQSAYNVILGRSFINGFRAVVSTRHFCMKFSTPAGIATVKGDPLASMKIYLNTLKIETPEILAPVRDLRATPLPLEGAEEVPVPGDTLRTIRIAANLEGTKYQRGDDIEVSDA